MDFSITYRKQIYIYCCDSMGVIFVFNIDIVVGFDSFVCMYLLSNPLFFVISLEECVGSDILLDDPIRSEIRFRHRRT